MIEMIMLGRGGQGVVVASKMFASAVFHEGQHVQAMSAYGGERRGAAVMSYVRADSRPIRLHCRVYQADYLIILDVSLLKTVKINDHIKPGARVILNAPGNYAQRGVSLPGETFLVDADRIARDLKLGHSQFPIVNTAVLGAVASVSGLAKIGSLSKAIKESVPIQVKQNVQAAQRAFREVAPA